MRAYTSDSSPSSSPVRKRQRLSSPTYDQQLGDLTQADIEAFDQIEACLSQSTERWPHVHSSSQNHLTANFKSSSLILPFPQDDTSSARTNVAELTYDPENPFTSALKVPSVFTTASSLVIPPTTLAVGFSKASAIKVKQKEASEDFDRSPSPEAPPDQDYDSWFKPANEISTVSFQTASSSLSAFTGFSKASEKGFIVPSSAALLKAKAKMKDIWQDSEPHPSFTPNETSDNLFQAPSSSSKKSPFRPPFRPISNSLLSPQSEKYSASPSTTTRSTQPPSFMTPTQAFITKNSRPFKSPLITKNVGSPSVGITTAIRPNPFATARSQHPLGLAPLVANASSLATPVRQPRLPLTTSSTKRIQPAPFITPFKPGMAPGQPGRAKLEETLKASQVRPAKRKAECLMTDIHNEQPGSSRADLFSLEAPANRQTLQASGLIPQKYTTQELEVMGINTTELSQITPTMAMYYSFHTPAVKPSLFPLSTPPDKLGMEEAYKCLLERGCSLATQEWVNNHWCLILWKLVGMVGLEPERETIPEQKRWSWDEVMKQLLYRYERELHQGKRPPLRLITTRDASAAYPMVLCISDIFSPSSHETEIEVTDGWYRLRAQIDAPMVRAVRRGHIRIGRKIALAGAYLFSEKKDASEVLEAYNSMKLVISGNSSHLAPWHAKLGFSPRPFIATFRSLTSDGGMVAAMDIVVVKMHPIAYLEFIQGEDGTSTHQAPRKEDAEAAAHEKWKQNRNREFSKLYAQYEKKWDRYEGHIARLERRSGSLILTSSQEEFPLDVLENLYDELEDPVRAPNVIAGLGTTTCRQLAEFIRHRLNREKANAIEEIEHELQQICPPRFVKNFRIIVIQDARVHKHAGNRTAQLTVWDVRNLSFSEGDSPGSFEIGQRFLVTNLKPTQPTYWMGHEPGSEVYLCTGQHSRWTQIKSV